MFQVLAQAFLELFFSVSSQVFSLFLFGKPPGHPQHVLMLGTAFGWVPEIIMPMP